MGTRIIQLKSGELVVTNARGESIPAEALTIYHVETPIEAVIRECNRHAPFKPVRVVERTGLCYPDGPHHIGILDSAEFAIIGLIHRSALSAILAGGALLFFTPAAGVVALFYGVTAELIVYSKRYAVDDYYRKPISAVLKDGKLAGFTTTPVNLPDSGISHRPLLDNRPSVISPSGVVSDWDEYRIMGEEIPQGILDPRVGVWANIKAFLMLELFHRRT
jgi:hypothetical protein